MKRQIYVLMLAMGLSACNSQKAVTSAKVSNDCPPKGTCTVELIPNKSLEVKTDEFGSLYYALTDDPTKSVIKYEFNKGHEETLPDSGYREEIIFETNAKIPEMNVSGRSLQETKMLYGRFCFCRGQTGYYRVGDGNLEIKEASDGLLLNLDFKITEVPQITEKINIILK